MNINSNSNESVEYPASFAGKVNFNTSMAKADFITVESYKTLRSNILFCGKNVNVILVTSTTENEGKSTISMELSKSFSEIGKRTLMIDADMRRSAVLKHNLKSRNVLGLSDLLSGQAELNQIIYNTQIPEFDIIFSGRFPPNPVELLSSPFFKEQLDILRKTYDYIIIDSPPLLPVIDAAVISTYCDGVLLVISPGKVKTRDAIAVKKQLEKSSSKILGVVLNESNPKYKDLTRHHKNYYYYNSQSSNTFKKQ